MRSRILRIVGNRLRGSRVNVRERADLAKDPSPGSKNGAGEATRINSGVEKYYQRHLHSHLRTFNSFALQSRSQLAKDVYSLAASSGRHEFFSLMLEIDELLELGSDDKTVFQSIEYRLEILLALANYVLDTARKDIETQAGLQILRLVLNKFGADALDDHEKMQFVEAAAELGNYEEQTELVERFDLRSIAPLQHELMAVNRIARDHRQPQQWVDAMNKVYDSLAMTPIILDEDDSLPMLDRLTSTPDHYVDGPKVTVIMPTYSPNSGIFSALRSLLHQTWSNLEILVVDDGSPQEYDSILNQVENFDRRIRVVRQEENRGAYSARNAGLSLASGEYITTHDDDDWSHPDKIAIQAAALLDDDSIVATTAAHIRTTEHMEFRRINARPQHLQTNYSSLMFRKSISDEIGDWDTSSRGSDTEFSSRITQNFGTHSLLHFTNKPMSFSRVWDGSLTSGEIYRGYFSYSRLLYRWSFRQWHRDVKKAGNKPKLDSRQARPFAIPTTFEPENRNKDLGTFDVIFVTDYSRQSRFVNRVLEEIESAIEFGFRVGYMHIDSPQTLKRTEIPSRLFEIQRTGRLTQVGDKDTAEARLLLVYDASIGMFLDEFKSTVVVQSGLVVDDQGGLLSESEARRASEPRIVLENLDRSFDTRFNIVGAALEDHERLTRLLPGARLLDDDNIWYPHITGGTTKIKSPKGEPVLGFHSFGNQYRWPSRRDVFENVYASDTNSALFYGVIKPARVQFGDDIIQDSQYLDRADFSLDEFLARIDFWAYFPHERLLDRPWQSALQALRAGKVVIMPPRLEFLYGSAAVYAQPEQVKEVVNEFARDSQKYIQQAQRGQKFVEDGFSSAAYTSRLKSQIPSAVVTGG